MPVAMPRVVVAVSVESVAVNAIPAVSVAMSAPG
jgi:hypothetical protein